MLTCESRVSTWLIHLVFIANRSSLPQRPQRNHSIDQHSDTQQVYPSCVVFEVNEYIFTYKDSPQTYIFEYSNLVSHYTFFSYPKSWQIIFCERPESKCFRLCGHVVPVVTESTIVMQQQLQIIHKQTGMTVFQENFTKQLD